MTTYAESQRIRNPWIIALLWLVLFVSFASIILVIFTDYTIDLTPDDRLGIQITAITFILITALFGTSRLETKIDKTGIYVRFLPLLRKWRFYDWNEIKHVHVRKFSPLLEYGGWGLRIGIMGQGKAYIISGNQGLKIELKSGKKLLIGTQKEIELKEFLNTLEISK